MTTVQEEAPVAKPPPSCRWSKIKTTCRTNLYTSCMTKGSKGNCLLYTKTASAPRRPPAARLASRFGASCLTWLWWWATPGNGGTAFNTTPICSLLPHLGDGKGSGQTQFSSVQFSSRAATARKSSQKNPKNEPWYPSTSSNPWLIVGHFLFVSVLMEFPFMYLFRQHFFIFQV